MVLKIPFFKRRSKRESTYIKSELLNEKSPFIITEAYKTMRTNLIFMLSEGKKVVAFASSMPGEGKTTTCLNMAIAFAQAGSRILVIDMDMRKPRCHRYFEIPSSPGLSDTLGNFTDELAISKTEIPNLDILPVGTIPPSPPELLMSDRLDKILETLKEQYDYIFLDTPPVHVVTDIAIVGSRIDGVVFVVRENSSDIDLVKQSIASLEQVNARVLGFILNDSVSDRVFYQYRYNRKYRLNYDMMYGYSLPMKEQDDQ